LATNLNVATVRAAPKMPRLTDAPVQRFQPVIKCSQWKPFTDWVCGLLIGFAAPFRAGLDCQSHFGAHELCSNKAALVFIMPR
jgi:hypothetical protein